MSLPERIGRYRILGFLASGGMAEILLAKLIGPGGFERAVVLKRVLPHLARQSEFRDMFLDEARIVARIRHPNVVDVSELGQEGRELYMVMEYLAGESVNGLMRRLDTRGERLDPVLASFVIAESAAGLHAAHELRSEDGVPLGLVHRDVSPQNVFLTYDGGVKLLDFGIAKFGDRSVETHTGQLKGKFAYMSPEQCCSDVLDARSDVFSLGILLWELVTGSRLFARSNELLVWKAIVEEPIPTASERLVSLGGEPISPKLEAVLAKALARDKAARYATAGDMRRDLVTVLRELDPEQRGPDQLAALMRSVFPDRIQQKEEMLRRVRAGDVITSVPSAEVDLDRHADADSTDDDVKRSFVVPLRTAATGDTDPSASVPATTSTGEREGISWRTIAFATLVICAVGAGAVAGLGWDRGDPVAASRPPAIPDAVEDRGGPESEARTVRVDVETMPPGASVEIAGEARGVTPLSIELARGSSPVELAIRLEGHREQLERLVPDVDQRVRLTLVREAPERAGSPSKGRTSRVRRPPRSGPARSPSSSSSGSGGSRGSQDPNSGFFRFD